MIETPLVGRAAVLAELHAALAASAAGVGSCVVVEGPAGIGKSRLLAVASDDALRLGMAVAQGRASELDRVAPMTTLMTSLQRSRPVGVDLGDLPERDGNRFWLIDRLGDVIAAFVRERPLVVIVDDAQWADELTSLALRVLVPALASSPVTWLLARRPVPARSPAQDAIDWLVKEGARQLKLDPLSDDAVRDLCEHILGAGPDSSVLTLIARCGGNPFLLEQLLSTLRASGQVLTGGGTATVLAGELPSSFYMAVDQRLRDLTPDARGLLEAGSVFGRPFSLHEASALVGRTAVELLPAANEAVASGTLVDTGSELAFSHDLIREAIYNSLPGPARLALHREAAAVAQTEGRSPVEIAEHLVRSGRKGDAQAVQVLRDAAAQIAPNAPGTAADLILRVLDLVNESDPDRPHLVADAVRLLAAAGRVVEARDLGEAALRSGLEPAAEAVLLLGLAEALKHVGHNAAVVRYTQRALATPGIPEGARAQLLAIQAHGMIYVDDIEGADASGADAAEVGTAAGEHSAVVFGLVARSIVARTRGELTSAIEHARRAVDVADTAGGAARQRHPRLWLARALAAVDRFQEADSTYATGQREADHLGTAWSQPLWHYYRAELRMAAGRLDDAQAEAEAGVRVAERLAAFQLTVPLLALLARVAVRRDDMTAARAHLKHTQRLLADGVTVGAADLNWTVALFQEACGQLGAAVGTIGDLYDSLPHRLLLLSEDNGAGAALVRMAQQVGQPDQAELAARAARELADRNPQVRSLAGAAAHAEGLFTGDLKLLREAVELYRESPRPLARASALEDAALAEHEAGDREDAVRLFEGALELYLTSGAKRDVARVQKRLRMAGVRRRLRAEPVGAVGSTTWHALTQSELRVVRLVAEGLTNREVADRLFLSPHTVDSHLRHVFTKLGIQSRVELTRQFLEHTPPDPGSLELSGSAH